MYITKMMNMISKAKYSKVYIDLGILAICQGGGNVNIFNERLDEIDYCCKSGGFNNAEDFEAVADNYILSTY